MKSDRVGSRIFEREKNKVELKSSYRGGITSSGFRITLSEFQEEQTNKTDHVLKETVHIVQTLLEILYCRQIIVSRVLYL